MTLYRRRQSKPSPKKEMQKAKWLSEEALQTAEERREVKAKELYPKQKIYPFECRVPKNRKER